MCSLQACEGAGHDFDENKLLDDQDKLEFTKLTEMVRCTYMNYLEKQLFKNFKTCYAYKQHGGKHILGDEEAIGPIKQTAKLLEDKAVAACMITQFYQKAMVKIISAVRRSTEENRLITQLEKNILQPVCRNLESCSKQTQTEKEEAGLQENSFETHALTLDEKIELFQSKLNPVHKIQPPVKRNHHTYSSDLNSSQHKKKTPKRTHNHHRFQHNDKLRQYSPFKENLEHISPSTSSTVTPMQPFKSSDAHQEGHSSNSINESVGDLENSQDSVAIELARLFSEEKTELDEIFGINPNDNPDDPQICEILKEIEQAKVCHKQNPINESEVCQGDKLKSNTHCTPAVNSHEISHDKDLSKSLWPCELFMQRRKLSESLARLIEEDLRWHDLIKWRFLELFGADSDDEFTSYSPSIELDEILMGSCVKRISPWVVKYLMKPMNEGLIGNRFIFKKLAKHIARAIITENQYPDESVIKRCIENYFCLHQSVLSLDDYHFVPSISLF